MKLTLRPVASGIMVVLLSITPVLAQAPAQQQQPEFVKQGQQLMREGKPEEALALYRQTLQTSPDSVPANIAAGSVLDTMGKGEEARKYFTKQSTWRTRLSTKQEREGRWRCQSDTRTPAATETLIESQPPLIGM